MFDLLSPSDFRPSSCFHGSIRRSSSRFRPCSISISTLTGSILTLTPSIWNLTMSILTSLSISTSFKSWPKSIDQLQIVTQIEQLQSTNIVVQLYVGCMTLKSILKSITAMASRLCLVLSSVFDFGFVIDFENRYWNRLQPWHLDCVWFWVLCSILALCLILSSVFGFGFVIVAAIDCTLILFDFSSSSSSIFVRF